MILPNAQVKFFVTVSDRERARRRYLELIAKGEPDTFDYAEFIAAGKAEKQREKEEKNTYHRSV